MDMNNNKIIIIAGPTAVGKTKLSIEIAKELDSEIISMDSMQVYENMNIGTAKITTEEMQNIKHYMISEIPINVDFNIKLYKEMVSQYINEIQNKNKIPILVGGTGFYIDAILYDTNFEYEDDDIKNQLVEKYENILKNNGEDYLHNLLYDIDKESYDSIHKNNTKRVIRALCYYELHNKKFSLHNKEESIKTPKYNFNYFLLNDNRENLYDRINKRVDKMINDGLIDEIIALIKSGAKKDSNAMSAIGYKELYDYCYNMINNNTTNSNEAELKKIIDDIKQHSRNYAKRQLTWFKANKDVKEININDFEYDFDKIKKYILNICLKNF